MNCVTLKRSHFLDDEQQDTFPKKRRRKEKKSTKLPDKIDAIGKYCKSLKRSLSFKDDSNNIWPPKRMCRKSNPTDTPKKGMHGVVPKDFLKGLPVLLDTDSSDSEVDCQSSQIDTTKSVNEESQKLFSYEMLKSICAGMMKEREDTVREEYEAALSQKMVEQYDTFIKFTHDQMQRDNGISASYLT
ncbi:akirin [Drosophila biarmipes]|uniref:akirin n=1 Tax=Drosophila biarmipes TaxID=125945 RepID=UPI0007E63D62|nr:akirin [Drosophila biarmipes]